MLVLLLFQVVESSWVRMDQIKYDIFINHQGPNTKYSFVTFLQEGLEEKQYT